MPHLGLLVLEHFVDAGVEGGAGEHGGDGVGQVQHRLEDRVHGLQGGSRGNLLGYCSSTPPTLGQEVCEPHLGPLAGPLLGPDGAPLLGVQRSDEGADGGAAHDVDGDPRLLHGLDHAHVGAAPAPESVSTLAR